MPQLGSGGAVAWARRWWRALLSELVATALLVLLGIGSLLPYGGVPAPLAHPALAFGFVVLANVQVFGPISGAHMNPAVTLAALIFGKVSAGVSAAYCVVQAAGALIGFGILVAVAPATTITGGAGCTAPAPGVSAVGATVVEAVLTGLLALLCCALWTAHDDARPDHAVPIKFGLTVAGLVYAGGLMTGASINPVRSLAPAILQNSWRHHWVYWVGPLGGAAAATLLYRLVLAPAPRRAADAPPPPPVPEELPLHNKADH